MNSFIVAVDATNPGEYLAVCGIIELVGLLDRSSTSAWTRKQGLVAQAQSAICDVCEILTLVKEEEFVGKLAKELGSREAWRAVTDRARVPLADAVGKWTAGVEFMLPGCHDAIVIDHWYERAFVNGDRVVQKPDKKRDGKGRWKFWAGQQDSRQGITGLLLDLVDASAKLNGVARVQDILAFGSTGSSRLNVDAATTRSSIDRGISANDAAANGGAIGRPGLELLAAIGLSAFFPPRRYGDAAPDGTVGVHKRLFSYFTWTPQAPVCLARLCARGVSVPGFQGVRREAPIGMMGQYSYLRFARPAGVGGMAAVTDETTDEEMAEEMAEENSHE
jgi:CRISPR-associated protein Csb3